MKNKKGLTGPMAALSGLALGIFVFAIYFAVTMKGIQAVQGTEAATSTLYKNLTALLGSVGQFTNYTDLIVIVGILSVVIGMVVYLGGNRE